MHYLLCLSEQSSWARFTSSSTVCVINRGFQHHKVWSPLGHSALLCEWWHSVHTDSTAASSNLGSGPQQSSTGSCISVWHVDPVTAASTSQGDSTQLGSCSQVSGSWVGFTVHVEVWGARMKPDTGSKRGPTVTTLTAILIDIWMKIWVTHSLTHSFQHTHEASKCCSATQLISLLRRLTIPITDIICCWWLIKAMSRLRGEVCLGSLWTRASFGVKAN